VTAAELVGRFGLPLATFATCVVSGFVPLVSAELFLLAVAALAPDAGLSAIALLATLGQMVAKSGMYLGGKGVLRLPLGGRRADLDALRARIERWSSRDLLVFVSAAVGLPPFFATSILAGTLRFPFARFVVVGFAGRLLRFSLFLAVPSLGRWLLHGA
jgi:membrane protein YqaA with SNARE-associated domain